jgi:hypothetical protein
MAIALVSNVRNTPAANGNTSGSIDTTGASLLVMHVSTYSQGPDPTVSDSKGNTWTALTAQDPPVSEPRSQLFYVANPTVGSGHTFTVAGTGIFHVTCAAAFSGALTVSPFDQQNGARSDAAATSLQPGSVTPTEDNELVVTGIATGSGSSGAYTVGSSFTKTNEAAYANSVNEGGGLAYLVQGTAAAVNPQWSWTGSALRSATIATFKAAAVGGGTTVARLVNGGLVNGGMLMGGRLVREAA